MHQVYPQRLCFKKNCYIFLEDPALCYYIHLTYVHGRHVICFSGSSIKRFLQIPDKVHTWNFSALHFFFLNKCKYCIRRLLFSQYKTTSIHHYSEGIRLRLGCTHNFFFFFFYHVCHLKVAVWYYERQTFPRNLKYQTTKAAKEKTSWAQGYTCPYM